MPRNTLVIGLGGTGVWSATYLKRDLIQTYGRVPENIKIVCFDTITLDPQKVEKMRREGLAEEGYGLPSIGGVALEAGKEYFYVGGDAKPICEELQADISRTKYPTIRPWLQFDWYLRNLPSAQMDLDTGASWRQLGRLALFVNERKVFELLQSAIQSFPANQHLDIVIVSSLAGGTGSGMFVDIALLARHFAEQHIQQVEGGPGYIIFGIFALASTFDAIGADKGFLRRNCFAALRTLDRFLRTSGYQYEVAYPTHSITYKASLFDYCALVGGLRQQDSLHEVRPDFGVFPSISDFLFALIDDASGASLSQFVFRNSGRAETQLNQNLPEWEKRRYYFSFGTYAYIYPADDILTELTLKFAKELLDSYLLARIKVTGTGEGRTYELESIQEPLTYRDNFCQNPGDPYLQRFLSVLPDVALRNPEMAKGFTMESMISMLRNYDQKTPTEEWQRDEEIMNRRVWARPSKKYGDDLAAGAYRIPNEVEGYKTVHLGHLIDPETNLRLQGEFQQVLERFSQRLKERFAMALGRRVIELLNGTANSSLSADQRVKKGENLCLAVFFVERLIVDVFEGFIRACKEAQKMVLSEYARQQTVVEEVRNDMVDARFATLLTPIPIFSYIRAHNLQYAYIASEQELIDIECKYHCFEALIKTTEGFIEVANRILEELRRWKKILVDNLYDDILRRLELHRAMREHLKQIKVRRYLTDDAHEQQLYQQYRNSRTEASHNITPMDDALNSLRWNETGSWLDETGRLELVRYDGTSDTKVESFRQEKDHNRNILLRLIRPYFEPIYYQTVLDRLITAFPKGADFANDANNHTFPMTQAGGTEPAATVAIPRAQTDEQTRFRDDLNAESVTTWVNRQGENYALSELANRQVALMTRIVMGIQGEFAANQEVFAGKNPQLLYEEWKPKSILHLFAAEINAVDYEAKLGDINEPYRYLHPEVVALLEDRNHFKAFTMAYLFDFIKPEQIIVRGDLVWTYLLHLDGNSYRLTLKTEATNYLSLILEAARYFISGKDATNPDLTFDPAYVLQRCYEFMDRETQGRLYRQLQWLEERDQKLQEFQNQQDQRLKDLAAVMRLELKAVEENTRRGLGELAELLRHQDELRSFCFAWLYELIKPVQERKDTSGNKVFDWVLEMDQKRWWLSKQGNRSSFWAIFVPSVKQFVIEGHCAQISSNAIDIRAVNEKWQEKVGQVNAAEFERDVRQRLNAAKDRAKDAPQSVQTLLQIFEDIMEEEIRIRKEAEEAQKLMGF